VSTDAAEFVDFMHPKLAPKLSNISNAKRRIVLFIYNPPPKKQNRCYDITEVGM